MAVADCHCRQVTTGTQANHAAALPLPWQSTPARALGYAFGGLPGLGITYVPR